MHKGKERLEGVAMVENVQRMYECVGVDVRWKGRGGEAEKRMILDASCDPLSIQMK